MTTDDPNRRPRTAHVLGDIVIERRHLTEQHGDDHDDIDLALSLSDAFENALATPEGDPRLRTRLVGLAAVAVQWVEAIDERTEASA